MIPKKIISRYQEKYNVPIIAKIKVTHHGAKKTSTLVTIFQTIRFHILIHFISLASIFKDANISNIS